MLLAINSRKHVPMPANRGQFIHYNNYPLYKRVAGGINSNVVGVGRLKRRLDLCPIRELILTSNLELGVSTQRLVYRLIRRLNLTRSIVRGLVARGLERRFAN
jgi:hypothetical protein